MAASRLRKEHGPSFAVLRPSVAHPPWTAAGADLTLFAEAEVIVRLLLLLPFIGLLWIPFYNRELPSLFGFPFFYWYQFLWVPITSLLVWIVYRHGVRQGEE